MNKVKYYIGLCLLPVSILTLVACGGGGEAGGEFDIVGLVKNPIIQLLIFCLILWFLFKGGSKK